MPDIDGLLYTSFLTNNDSKALEALFNKYRDGLILFIYGFVQNIDEAEELMMDTFAVLVSGTAERHVTRKRLTLRLKLGFMRLPKTRPCSV